MIAAHENEQDVHPRNSDLKVEYQSGVEGEESRFEFHTPSDFKGTKLISGRLLREQLELALQEEETPDENYEASAAFIESAKAIDIICLETVQLVEDIIKICSTPAEIKNFDGFLEPAITKEQVFLWLIEEAVTNSYQLLNLEDDAVKWNSTFKRRLKSVLVSFSSLHKIVADIYQHFLEVDKQVTFLGSSIKQRFSGNINAAAALNGEYANRKFNEVVQTRENKMEVQEISEYAFRVRLALGSLAVKRNNSEQWIKFKTISSKEMRIHVIDAIISEFLKVKTTTEGMLQNMNITSDDGSRDFGIGRIIHKVRSINQVFQTKHTFLPKAKTLMLQEWLKAEVGIDFLISKIEILYKITRNLLTATDLLYRKDFLVFLGENGRSTLPIDKFSSVEVEINPTNKRYPEILNRYLKEASILKDSELVTGWQFQEGNSQQNVMMETKENIDEGQSPISSEFSFKPDVRPDSDNLIFNTLENLKIEYKIALQELQHKEIIVEDHHLDLCSDKIKMFHDKIIFVQKTMSQNNKIITENSQSIFNLQDSSLNPHIKSRLGMTFQLLQNYDCDSLSSSEKDELQSIAEKLVRNVRIISQSVWKYRECLEEERLQLREYIGEFVNMDTPFSKTRSPNELKLQQMISQMISKINRKGKNSILPLNDENTLFNNFNSYRVDLGSTEKLFREMKVDLLLKSIPILICNGISENGVTKKDFSRFYFESNMKILRSCLLQLSDLCKYISGNLISMLTSIKATHGTTGLRACLKPDSSFINLHNLEKYVIFKALFISEQISNEHWDSFEKFDKLLETLVGTFEILKNQVIENGMLEKESRIILENKISDDVAGWLDSLSEFGNRDFEDMTQIIEDHYHKRVLDDIADVQTVSTLADSDVFEDECPSSTSLKLSTVDKAFLRFLREEHLRTSVGMDLNNLFISKLKTFEELIAGKLSDISKSLYYPKVSQTQATEDTFPVGYVNIFSFLTCITSMKVRFHPAFNPANLGQLKNEFRSLIETIDNFRRMCKTCKVKIKKIESFIRHKEISKKYRTYTKAQVTEILTYLGEPSVTKILAEIWCSEGAPYFNNAISANQINLSWDTSGNNRVICQGSNLETIDFTELDLDTQVRLIATCVKIIHSAFKKAEVNFTELKKNISVCHKEVGFLWKKTFVRSYYNTYSFAMHSILLKYTMVEASLVLRQLKTEAKDVRFYISFANDHLFGKPKNLKFSPVKCENFTVHVISNTIGTMGEINTSLYTEADIEQVGNTLTSVAEVEFEELKLENSNVQFEEDDDKTKVSAKISVEKQLESGDSLFVPLILNCNPSKTFGEIGVAANRLESLLTLSLKQCLEMIKLPNAALEEHGFLKKGRHIDFIQGLVTLISCAAIELHLFTTVNLEMLSPLEREYKKAYSYFEKCFENPKSHVAIIKVHMNKMKKRLDEFTTELCQGAHSLENFIANVMSSAENFEENDGDISLSQDLLFNFIHNFDLAKLFAKEVFGTIWSARWGMDNLGIILKNQVTHENHSFRNLSLENQINVLKSFIKFFAFVLKTVGTSMKCLKENSEKASTYFKTHFLKLARNLLQLQNNTITANDSHELCRILQKLSKILSDSVLQIDEIARISENASNGLKKAIHYIQVRFSLESTLEQHPRMKGIDIDTYRPNYAKALKDFESNLLLQHNCSIGTAIPLEPWRLSQ